MMFDVDFEFEQKFIEQSGLSKGDYLQMVDRFEELIGTVYHSMWEEFPDKMSVKVVDTFLQREIETEAED